MKPKGHIVHFVADPKYTLEPPKGTVPFGKGLARTLVITQQFTVTLNYTQTWTILYWCTLYRLCCSIPVTNYGSNITNSIKNNHTKLTEALCSFFFFFLVLHVHNHHNYLLYYIEMLILVDFWRVFINRGHIMRQQTFSPVWETILIQSFNYTLVLILMKITKV